MRLSVDLLPAAGRRRLLPGERVIVFKADALGGATLGYYATIVDVRTSSLRRHPVRPERWVYSVALQSPSCRIDVSAGCLFATGRMSADEGGTAGTIDATTWEVRQHGHSNADGTVLNGAYRIACGDWLLFTFRKRPVPWPRYRLIRPMPVGPHMLGRLEYDVPLADTLDGPYVLRAIAQLCGVEFDS